MPEHKALLVQNVRDFLLLIDPYLDQQMEAFIHTGINKEDVILWMIAEELECGYGLFSHNHIHNRMPHTVIHSCLQSCMPVPFATIAAFYIKAPRIYADDNDIEIQLKGCDLYIKYFCRDQKTSFYQIVKRP